MKKHLNELLRGKRPITDVWQYFVGHYREYVYYTNFKWLIRKHIREQIEYRLAVMNKTCYSRGECIKCGCSVPALQMASKACEGSCYPKMMNKFNWVIYRTISEHLKNRKLCG